MDKDILFTDKNEQRATERVLATVRVKIAEREINFFKSEISDFLKEADSILKENNLKETYSSKDLNNLTEVKLDNSHNNIDFRVKEILEDILKRVNTRINLINNYNNLINELKDTYKIKEENLEKDIEISNLDMSKFEEILKGDK